MTTKVEGSSVCVGVEGAEEEKSKREPKAVLSLWLLLL
jgi:hypothetical protein